MGKFHNKKTIVDGIKFDSEIVQTKCGFLVTFSSY